MFHKGRLFSVSCVLGGLVLLQPGCGSDAKKRAFDEVDGGPDAGESSGGKSGTGGSSAGGRSSNGGALASGGGGAIASGGAGPGGAASVTGGASSTGGANTGGDTDGGADAGPGSDASVDGASPVETDAAPDGRTPDGGTVIPPAPLLVVSGSDYTTQTEVTAIDLTTLAKTSSTIFPDHDVSVVQGAGRAFVLQKTNDRVTPLNAKGEPEAAISLRADGGAASLNPHDLVFVKGKNGAPDRAFVSLYNANRIDVLNVSTGTVEKSIDLAPLLDVSDTDGSVNVDVGAYVEGSGRVFFAVQHLDPYSGTPATGYAPLCPPIPSVLVSVDTTTLDLVGGTDGGAPAVIPLNLLNPTAIHYDAAGNRLLVTSSGCVDLIDGGASPRGHLGIESVPVDGGAPTVLFVPDNPGYLSGLIPLDGAHGVVQQFAVDYSSFNSWYWTFTEPAVGAPLSDMPETPAVESPTQVIGTRRTFGENAAVELVRYDVFTGITQVVFTDPWDVRTDFTGSTVIVR